MLVLDPELAGRGDHGVNAARDPRQTILLTFDDGSPLDQVGVIEGRHLGLSAAEKLGSARDAVREMPLRELVPRERELLVAVAQPLEHLAELDRGVGWPRSRRALLVKGRGIGCPLRVGELEQLLVDGIVVRIDVRRHVGLELGAGACEPLRHAEVRRCGGQ